MAEEDVSALRKLLYGLTKDCSVEFNLNCGSEVSCNDDRRIDTVSCRVLRECAECQMNWYVLQTCYTWWWLPIGLQSIHRYPKDGGIDMRTN